MLMHFGRVLGGGMTVQLFDRVAVVVDRLIAVSMSMRMCMFMRMRVLMSVRMHCPVGMSMLVSMHMSMRMIVLDWAGHDGFLP
jgi:hypothetical protein